MDFFKNAKNQSLIELSAGEQRLNLPTKMKTSADLANLQLRPVR